MIKLIPILLILFSNTALAGFVGASLTFDPPTTREDGSVLTKAEIDKFEVYLIIDSAEQLVGEISYDNQSDIATGNVAIPVQSGSGTIDLCVKTVDKLGLKSTVCSEIEMNFTLSPPKSPNDIQGSQVINIQISVEL